MAGTRALLFAAPGCSWRLLAAPRSSLGAYGRFGRLMAEISENHCFIKQNLNLSFPRTILNVSHELYSSSFLGLVFLSSGAKARKSSNRVSWDSFYRFLEPMLETSNRASWDSVFRFLEPRPASCQIEFPGSGFVDSLSQGQEVIKSSLLGLVFSASGAKARKSSNRLSWDSFC